MIIISVLLKTLSYTSHSFYYMYIMIFLLLINPWVLWNAWRACFQRYDSDFLVHRCVRVTMNFLRLRPKDNAVYRRTADTNQR